jgi:hypothetical protein
VYFDVAFLYEKLFKYYKKGDIFRAFMLDEEFFPLSINLKKLQQKDIQNSFTQINNEIAKLQKEPFEIVFGEFSFKTIGRQKIPLMIRVDGLKSYLRMIDKTKEYENFVKFYRDIVLRFPPLKELFLKKPFWVLEYVGMWDRLLGIVEYFAKNPKPNIYTREITIEGVDTKFIQKHQKIIDACLSYVLKKEPLNSLTNFAFEKKYNLKYPLAQVRFRILDEAFHIFGMSDITLCIDEFERFKTGCKNVYIVENKITTLSFMKLKNSMVIFGSGYGVSVLKDIKWLNEKNIYYWGDIDLDGYAILSQLRGYFPHTKSLMMDMRSFEKFRDLNVTYNRVKPVKVLKNLTKPEADVYELLSKVSSAQAIRIEQEKIPYDYLRGVLSRF